MAGVTAHTGNVIEGNTAMLPEHRPSPVLEAIERVLRAHRCADPFAVAWDVYHAVRLVLMETDDGD